MTSVRVRFAPAPTGYLHVGSARSALFNWLFARHHGGTMILRIEDTDESLKQPEFLDAIFEPLAWLGIDWDEGPYYQSERRDLHVAAVTHLLDDGLAYRCDCTREQIDERAASAGGAGYDGHCRHRAVAEAPGVVVRFRAPDSGVTAIDDLIRGRVEFANADIEDFVIRRSDGSPVFLVANAVDDAEMDITHVIRGEDLLNTTPKVLLLRAALGHAEPPAYAHLPLLVNESRKKLSKRRDDVSLGDYIERGYLPEAMVNYLALLGWGPTDDVEIRPLSEIVDRFRIEDVSKGSAFFDAKKLDHFNATYLRALSPDEFVERARPWLGDRDPAVLAAVAPEVQQRCTTLADAVVVAGWLYDEPDYDEKAWTKAMEKGASVPEILDGVIAAFADCAWEPGELDRIVRRVGDDLGAKSQVPVRVAVTGTNGGIPLWDPLVLLGRERTLARLRRARARL